MVADVAVDALPLSAPVNDVDVTEVSPLSVVLELPKPIAVVPMVTDEFAKPVLGIVALAVSALLPFAYTYPVSVEMIGVALNVLTPVIV